MDSLIFCEDGTLICVLLKSHVLSIEANEIS